MKSKEIVKVYCDSSNMIVVYIKKCGSIVVRKMDEKDFNECKRDIQSAVNVFNAKYVKSEKALSLGIPFFENNDFIHVKAK